MRQNVLPDTNVVTMCVFFLDHHFVHQSIESYLGYMFLSTLNG